MKTTKHAIVGVGVIGDWHVRILGKQMQHRSQLLAVCDLDVEKAKKSLDKHGLQHVPVFADEKEMLAKVPDIEVVHVATPSGAHADPSILAMEAGKHVIVEKPIEITLPKIDRMLDTAQKRGVRVAGIFQNRWNKANRAIKDAAAAGRFGKITFGGSYTPWYRTDQYYRDGGWRGTWALDGGGAIMNQSVHSVDLLQWIVGPVKQVSAYASSLIHPEIEVEDTLASAVVFENGAYGHLMGSTAIYPGGAVRVEVGGSDGMAVSESGLKVYRFRGDDAAQEADKALIESINATRSKTTAGGSSPTDLPTDLHQFNIEHILDSWAAGKDADTNGVEARKAVAIIVALYESAKKGGVPVKVS
ncbi:MAG: Gfo/Idh/MocA family oxidoreductase [Tepidisphaeraceae bacterium]